MVSLEGFNLFDFLATLFLEGEFSSAELLLWLFSTDLDRLLDLDFDLAELDDFEDDEDRLRLLDGHSLALDDDLEDWELE